ncbi:DUF1343 domain-containing protein [Coraliomargarita sp. SDUM461004]|uniref:DUF1343 domain-containing protein n=1 Tax=Thalassobacterium sedimentorum TaxID=3041258 RepID=A0ABU1AJ30_9BACT|nr:DUF1343 domain-containing protein [Coraliomargarita sp. SDUM461004]MDQ8194707.1 DUF1343 domain-containing protein [Coraliomargarita sp. SDUM461004]
MIKKLCLSLLPLFLWTGLIRAETIYLGIDVLEQSGFRAIDGKRIGLLTHPAGLNRRGESSIDVLRRAPNIRLMALFGPEHGIYGDEQANVPVDDKIDPRTGLPVYSLYGQYRKPTAKMLAGLDALVVDLQDIGVRSYTYVSCMRYAMEACFENGVEVVILDRPNPLGGLKVDGPPLDTQWRSYVGAFHVPYVHGLTIAELARIAKNSPGWMETPKTTREQGKLTIVPMQGWSRDMLWTQTGLRWVPTSPYIPDLSAVLGYAMTGLGAQEGGFSHGIGTPYPFRLLRYKGKSPAQLKAALEAKRISGLNYRIVHTKSAAGASLSGLYVSVVDWKRVRPTELSFHMMQLSAAWSTSNPFAASKNPTLFNKHVGSTAWWNEITQRGAQARVADFMNQWTQQAQSFQNEAKRFWLYR